VASDVPSPSRGDADPEGSAPAAAATQAGGRQPRDRSPRAALRITLIYALVSAAWIALSDQVLARLIPDPQAYTVAQTFKGWGFVAASAAIIYALIRRELGTQRHALSAGRVAEARMRQAADQVYTMVNSTPLAIILLGVDGKVGLWNPGAERIFGWSAEEVLGREPPFVTEDKRAEYEGNIGRVLAGESLTGVEAVRRRKDGTRVLLRLWTAPLRDERGEISATFAMFEDVTAGREAEEMLRRRDAVLAAVGGVAAELLQADRWQDRMDRVLQRLGQAMDASRTYLFEAHNGPGGLPVVSQRFEWCAAGIQPQIDNPELQNIPRRGSPMEAWTETLERGEVVAGNASDFPDAEPVFLSPEGIRSILLVPVFFGPRWWGVIGFDECTRERTWAQAEIEVLHAAASLLGVVIARQESALALEASEDRYRRLAENAPDVIFRYRLVPDAAFEYVSPAVTSLVGYTPAELYGEPDQLLTLVHPDDRPRLLRALEGQVSAAGALRLRWMHRNGREVWIEQQTSPIVDGQGRMVALEGIARDVTRQVEAEAAERRRAEQLAGLHQTSLEIGAEVRLEPLLNSIVERAARLVGTSMGSLFLTTADGGELLQVVDFGRSEEFLGARLRLGEGVSGRAAASGEPFMVEDHRLWPDKAPVFRDSTTGRVLALPLKTRGNTLGVLSLSDEAAGPFSTDEIRLATLFAEQAAIAIHNARLLEEARRHGEAMEALYQTAVEITSQTDLDKLLAAIVDRAADLVGVPVGGLYLLDETTRMLEMVVSRYPDREYAGTRIAIGEGVAGRAVERGEPFAVENYADWEGKAPVYDDVRLGRVLGVPLSIGKRMIGAVYVSDFQRGQFTPAEIRLVSLFADQAAVAIENARLLISERQRSTDLTRSRALIESLSRLAANLEKSIDPDQLLETLRGELQRLGIRCWLGLIDAASGDLRSRLLSTGSPRLSEVEAALRQASDLAGIKAGDIPMLRELISSGRPQLMDPSDLVAGIVPAALQAEFAGQVLAAAQIGPETQAIALPLVQADDVVGLLFLWADYMRAEDIVPLSVFGTQVSVALEKAQLLDETRRRAAYLEALTSVATALRVARDRDRMAPIILGQLLHLLGAQGSSLALRDEDTGGSITVLATGQWEAATGVRLGPGVGIVGEVLRTGRPKISTDIRTDPALARRELFREIPAVACVPLIVEHETIGCLMVGRQTPFHDEDVRLLTAIAEMAGNALHRAEVMETLEKRVLDRTRALEEANDRLQELDRLKSDFVSNVTHELRTPITNVLLYLDLLRLSPSAAKSAHYLEVLRSESARLGRLIEDLLTLSRLERGAIGMQTEPHPLDALLAEVFAAQLPSAQSRGVALRHDPNLDLPVAIVSRTQILQVFTNLVANAIAYAYSGGVVRLSTTGLTVGERTFVGARVFNDGPPIDPDDLPHIFERFYRGRTGQESGQPGTGLGLAISREIVERHTGWIEVESGAEGTTFTVWLPAAPQS
jgi:PAS domain S-box-containing protein